MYMVFKPYILIAKFSISSYKKNNTNLSIGQSDHL